jgi:hypothetical protein
VTPYAYESAVILTALASELGAPEPALVRYGSFDRAAAKDVFLALSAHTGAEIAGAASHAYARLFGSPLPAYELGPSRTSRIWRH